MASFFQQSFPQQGEIASFFQQPSQSVSNTAHTAFRNNISEAMKWFGSHMRRKALNLAAQRLATRWATWATNHSSKQAVFSHRGRAHREAVWRSLVLLWLSSTSYRFRRQWRAVDKCLFNDTKSDALLELNEQVGVSIFSRVLPHPKLLLLVTVWRLASRRTAAKKWTTEYNTCKGQQTKPWQWCSLLPLTCLQQQWRKSNFLQTTRCKQFEAWKFMDIQLSNTPILLQKFNTNNTCVTHTQSRETSSEDTTCAGVEGSRLV